MKQHLVGLQKSLGTHFATPIFDGASWDQVGHYLEKAGLPREGKTTLFDGRTGEAFKEKVTCRYYLHAETISLS